jgi:hypothetical protein
MASSPRALALILSGFMLVSCGGGGGGGGTATTPIDSSGPQSVAITETNAKPVAANALDATQNTSATRGANGVPVGVQVDTGAAAPQLQSIAEAARFAASSFTAAHLPAGVSVNETVGCTLGGTMTISGNVANSSGLSQGDSFTISASNCGLPAGSTTMVMSGQMQITIASGFIGTSLPFHVVMQTTATNLSVTSGGITAVANGDARLDWNATSATLQTLSATGARLTNMETISGVSHTTTMRNYTQSIAINGSTVTGSLQAAVETNSSRIGATAVQYTISTPTPVTWNSATRAATGGVIKVVGASNSQLLLTINGDGTATIQVDANGDGTFETTITTNTAELAGLL